MPRRKKEISGEGSKINRAFRKLGKDINKTIIKPAGKEFFNPATEAFQSMGSELGKFTNEQLLPGVVSVGIPLASTALGVLGTEVGLPPEITSKLSENIMKQYIPQQYQSKNKYVGLLSDTLQAGISGDPMDMMNLQNKAITTIGSDIGLVGKAPKQPKQGFQYNPDNPYEDLLMQLLAGQPDIPNDVTQQTQQQQIDTNPNDDNDARYSSAQLGANADSMIITTSPYQQREGNIDALLGAGIRKQRKPRRPKKIEIEEIEIYTKRKPSYKKFSHAKNTALEQLLEAKEEREAKESKKAMKDMVEKQTKALTALGYGISKPIRDSIEMKEKMARLRAMRKNKK